MIDLSEDLGRLVMSLEQSRNAEGRGRVVLFTSPIPGSGVSLVSREVARLAARRMKAGVWLFDLDFKANTHYRHFATPAQARQLGALGKPLNASLGPAPFWKLENSEREAAAVTLHRVGKSRLFVSRFNSNIAAQGGRIRIRSAKDYWKKLRATADLAVIDAPSPSRSRAGMALYGEADAVVFVIDGSDASLRAAAELAEDVEMRGGLPAGVVVNSARLSRAA